MDLNENLTDTPVGGTRGAEHVFFFFRFQLGDTPVRKLMRAAIIMQVFILSGLIPFLLFVPFLVMIVFPFVAAAILRKGFVNEVIPACRQTCSGEDIVRGAMQSLRFMWIRGILYLLPGLLIFFGLLSAYSMGNVPAGYFGKLFWLFILQILVFLMGDYALGLYPIARVFSRRAGSIVMMLVILLGQIVLACDFLCALTGFSYYTVQDGNVIGIVIQSIVILVVCAVFSIGGIKYFTKAALADVEQNGLPH